MTAICTLCLIYRKGRIVHFITSLISVQNEEINYSFFPPLLRGTPRITTIYRGDLYPPQQFKTALQSLYSSALPAIVWPLIHTNQGRRCHAVISRQWKCRGGGILSDWFLQEACSDLRTALMFKIIKSCYDNYSILQSGDRHSGYKRSSLYKITVWGKSWKIYQPKYIETDWKSVTSYTVRSSRGVRSTFVNAYLNDMSK